MSASAVPESVLPNCCACRQRSCSRGTWRGSRWRPASRCWRTPRRRRSRRAPSAASLTGKQGFRQQLCSYEVCVQANGRHSKFTKSINQTGHQHSRAAQNLLQQAVHHPGSLSRLAKNRKRCCRELYWALEQDMLGYNCGKATARRFARCLPCAVGKPGKCGSGSAAWFCRRRLSVFDTSDTPLAQKSETLLRNGEWHPSLLCRVQSCPVTLRTLSTWPLAAY